MSVQIRFITYLAVAWIGFYAGALLMEGRARDACPKGYQQGVKDCMTGRAKVEIKADTLIVVP